MSTSFNVGILGATGAVGEELLTVLAEREFPIKSLRLFASERSAGMSLTWKASKLKVEDIEKADLSGIQIAFFSAGGSTSKKYAGRFLEVGAVIIDNTSAFRMENAVPLVVPEVNPEALDAHRGLIANPNCSTIQLMAPLKALHEVKHAYTRRQSFDTGTSSMPIAFSKLLANFFSTSEGKAPLDFEITASNVATVEHSTDSCRRNLINKSAVSLA